MSPDNVVGMGEWKGEDGRGKREGGRGRGEEGGGLKISNRQHSSFTA